MKSQPAKIHSCQRQQARPPSKACKSVFILPPKKKFKFFSPTLRCFNFFATAQPMSDKHLDSSARKQKGSAT